MKTSINGKRVCYHCDRETQVTLDVDFFTVHNPLNGPSHIRYETHWLCPACVVEECKFDTRSAGETSAVDLTDPYKQF